MCSFLSSSRWILLVSFMLATGCLGSKGEDGGGEGTGDGGAGGMAGGTAASPYIPINVDRIAFNATPDFLARLSKGDAQ